MRELTDGFSQVGFLQNSTSSVSSSISFATRHTTFGCLWMQVANKLANSPPGALQSDGISNNIKKEENKVKGKKDKMQGIYFN